MSTGRYVNRSTCRQVDVYIGRQVDRQTDVSLNTRFPVDSADISHRHALKVRNRRQIDRSTGRQVDR